VILVAHDMGESVGCELMAGQDEGNLSFKIGNSIILNGSPLVAMVELADRVGGHAKEAAEAAGSGADRASVIR
jgi:hypothetical protein